MSDDVRALVEAERIGEAAELVLSRHGGGFFDYIARVVGEPSLAEEAYQLFSIRLWQALADFRWEASLKTWAYAIARNAAYGVLRDPRRRREQRLGTAEQQALAARRTRTETERWRRTGEKRRLDAALEALPPDERELMVLRLGRRMTWKEVAAVLHGSGTEALPERELTRLAATARKRYERIKARLGRALLPKDGKFR